MADDITYSFKEFWEDRFKRLAEDIGDVKRDVRDLRDGQQSNSRDIEQMKGKMIVYGSLSIILGTAIASMVVKFVGP